MSFISRNVLKMNVVSFYRKEDRCLCESGAVMRNPLLDQQDFLFVGELY